jgi:hypothetical protein
MRGRRALETARGEADLAGLGAVEQTRIARKHGGEGGESGGDDDDDDDDDDNDEEEDQAPKHQVRASQAGMSWRSRGAGAECGGGRATLTPRRQWEVVVAAAGGRRPVRLGPSVQVASVICV